MVIIVPCKDMETFVGRSELYVVVYGTGYHIENELIKFEILKIYSILFFCFYGLRIAYTYHYLCLNSGDTFQCSSGAKVTFHISHHLSYLQSVNDLMWMIHK